MAFADPKEKKKRERGDKAKRDIERKIERE